MKTSLRIAAAMAALCLLAAPPAMGGERQHLVFWKGTPQELDVYRIKGRLDGPTVMIMGGIQGDEPGGFLSADLYADLSLKRGNLIVVPRANFRSIIQSHRGPEGDMNRKFEGNRPDDPEHNVVDVIKCLMAESDLFLNLHDGSGFYRPTWESDTANPRRYGQSIIIDTDVHASADKPAIDLESLAARVVERVNREIDNPRHKFHVFNMRTVDADTPYKEQRKSATYFALTQIGIPAFAIETSKQLPSLEMKIRQHNLAVNAFLDLFGVEVEQPGISLEAPMLGYLVISVNNSLPLAVAAGQTLLVAPGDTIEVVHAGANYERGVSVEVQGLGGLNDMHRPVAVNKPTVIVARKDNTIMGQVKVDLLPERQGPPQLVGEARIRSPRPATKGTLDMLPGARKVAGVQSEPAGTSPAAPSATAATTASGTTPSGTTASGTPPGPGTVTGFRIEVDGRPVEIKPGKEVAVMAGARVKIVDLAGDGALPKGAVMNLRGFVPKANEARNAGEDRGFTADTGRDMQPGFSRDRKGEVYAINAELGSTVLASCSLRIVRPRLASVTLRFQGTTKTLAAGSRVSIPAGAKVELVRIALKDGAALGRPRFTLGGHPCPSGLPQTLAMRDIAINLAVFNGDVLAGKVTWDPK